MIRTRWLYAYLGPDMMWQEGHVLCVKLFPYLSRRQSGELIPAALSVEFTTYPTWRLRIGSDAGDGRHIGAWV